jgi:tRNA pseudouridine55 synthase
VGHTGTLDPFATGVLVVLIGRATRLAQFLSDVEKQYEAIIRLGYATDTGDRTGKPVPNSQASITGAREWKEEEIEAALKSLRGKVDQVPPMYSAKKQSGRKLYELARRGEEVDRKPVRVCVYEFEAIKPTGEWLKDNLDGTFDFEVRVLCSSGTYVRTLAEDFGKRFGVGAHLAELRRTQVGDFRIQRAKTLGEIQALVAEEALGTVLYTPDDALSRLLSLDLSNDDTRRAQNGLDIHVPEATWEDGQKVRLRDANNKLVAVGYFIAEKRCVHPLVVLAPKDA